MKKFLIGLIGVGLIVGAGLVSAQRDDFAWAKFYGTQDAFCGGVVMAEDGGFFIVGTTNMEFEPVQRADVYLIRTDAAGEVMWEKTYGGDAYESGLDITQTDDGNLLISGVATSSMGDMDAYLIKIDQDGNELWAKTYGGPLDEMAGGAAQVSEDAFMIGGIVTDPNDPVVDNPGIAGYGGLAGRSNWHVFKVDAEGNELWSKTRDSEDNIIPNKALQMADGGFLVLSTILYFPAFDDDLVLTKLDHDGNEVWSRTWTDDKITGQDMIETSNGNILIAASFSSFENGEDAKADYLFISVDPDGNELWRSTFGDPDMFDYGKLMVEAPDGGFVVIGERTRDQYTWETDLVLVKIDAEGQFVGERSVSASHTMFEAMFPHPDGGYIIGGAMGTNQGFRILLIRTNAEGAFTLEQ